MPYSMWNDLKSSFRFGIDGAKKIKLDLALKGFWKWIKEQWQR